MSALLSSGPPPVDNTKEPTCKKRPRQQQSKASSAATLRPIYVVVVESHQHVLEHIHDVLRKERLLNTNWSMLHFDSHPDLACPNTSIPARACFFPRETFPTTTTTTTTSTNNPSSKNNGQEEKNLYELLDSTAAGIAEWILPLVVAANLQRVHWVKPAAAAHQRSTTAVCPPQQLPTGIYTYQVGAALQIPKNSVDDDDDDDDVPQKYINDISDLPAAATVKVDWPHPYYLEDDSTIGYVSSSSDPNNDLEAEMMEQFLFPQSLELQVSELTADDFAHEPLILQEAIHDNNSPTQLWALDICLDYFACQNPFLTDLEAIDPAFTQALLEAVCSTPFYASNVMRTTPEARKTQVGAINAIVPNEYRQNLMQFRRQLIDYLEQEMKYHHHQQQQQVPHSTTINGDSWKEYYDDPKEGEACLNRLLHAFRTASCTQNDNGKALISMTEQALPNLTMPHTSSVLRGKTSDDKQVDSISMENIRPALERVQKELEHRSECSKNNAHLLESSYSSTPFIITMARSSSDGFTPKQVVEELQEQLIQHLHGLYCGCQHRRKSINDIATIAQSCQQPCEIVPGCRFRIIFDYCKWEGSCFT